jgi:hypothetical protein
MTDPELIERLATRGMGWRVYAESAHRPGSRPLPHCWRWRRDGADVLMRYDGTSNRVWNPLASEADRGELAARLGLGDVPSADDLHTLPLPDPTSP